MILWGICRIWVDIYSVVDNVCNGKGTINGLLSEDRALSFFCSRFVQYYCSRQIIFSITQFENCFVFGK